VISSALLLGCGLMVWLIERRLQRKASAGPAL
jgi:hypothetical protein